MSNNVFIAKVRSFFEHALYLSVITLYSTGVSMCKCLSTLFRNDTMTFNVSYQILSTLIHPWYVLFVMQILNSERLVLVGMSTHTKNIRPQRQERILMHNSAKGHFCSQTLTVHNFHSLTLRIAGPSGRAV